MGNYSIVRVQRLASRQYIDDVYRKDPDLAHQSYRAQHRRIVDQLISHTANFSEVMNELGNNAREVFSDARILQKTWARENQVSYGADWSTDILVAQLQHWKPEVLFFQDIHSLPLQIRLTIKELVPEIRLKVIQKGYPGETSDLSDADLLFVSSPILLQRYSQLKPTLLYHSFNLSPEQVEGLNGTEPYEPETCRAGFAFFGQVRVPELRYWMLRQLLLRTEIRAWIQEDPISQERLSHWFRNRGVWYNLRYGFLVNLLGDYQPSAELRKFFPERLDRLFRYVERLDENTAQKKKSIDGVWPKWVVPRKTLSDEFPSRTQRPVYGVDYYKKLLYSDVVFNCHADEARETVDNMRMFEVTGLGRCLLTDKGSNLASLFEEGVEMVTYSSLDEAIENAQYLLENDSVRVEIAKAGQKRTLKEHTLKHRCLEMDAIIHKRLQKS